MQWLIATQNKGKIKDFRAIFAGSGFEFIGVDEVGSVPEVVEDAPDFHGNALKKAQTLHEATGLPTIGDDSGLEVEALDGRPGVMSARYAGEGHDDAANNRKLLAELAHLSDPAQRRARFVCVLAAVRAGQPPLFVEGVCGGSIAIAPRGAFGFGYDPLFLPDDFPGSTMAELTPELKGTISHRGRAARALLEALTRP